MIDKELAIKSDAEEVRDKKLWQRSLRVVKKYGKYNEHMADCYSIVSYDLNVLVDGVWLKIYKSEYAMGDGEYIFINVNHRRVLYVVLSNNREDDPRVIRANNASNSPFLYVRTYSHIPGEWEKLLDGRKIGPALLRAKVNNRVSLITVGRDF